VYTFYLAVAFFIAVICFFASYLFLSIAFTSYL
jgi:hypothetical protein